MTHCSVQDETTLEMPSEGGVEESPILLVGNPNVGKSVLFRNLTQRYVTVSNYPGTTVEVVRARARFNGQTTSVIDTPGLNDLVPRSEDARVTIDILQEHPDATIVQVAGRAAPIVTGPWSRYAPGRPVSSGVARGGRPVSTS